MPTRLPDDDIKVVLRLRGRLNLRTVNRIVLQRSISKAAEIDDIALFRTDTFRYNEQQNTLIFSTPDETRAGKLNSIQGIEVDGRQYPVAAYGLAPDDTVKGVIHGIPAEDTDDIITTSLVHPGNPSIAQARRMGQSSSVVILSQGRRLPFWVRYGCVETRCFLHKKKQKYSENCGNLGHGADVCPRTGPTRCRTCGTRHPEQGHTCVPTCGMCGKGHPTGARQCKKLFRTPPETKLTTPPDTAHVKSPALRSSEFPTLETPRARSRSRYQYRSRSRTPRRVARPSRSRSRSKARHSVGWSEVAAGHPKTKPTSRTADKTSTNLAELKAMVENLQDTVARLLLQTAESERRRKEAEVRYNAVQQQLDLQRNEAGPTPKRRAVRRTMTPLTSNPSGTTTKDEGVAMQQDTTNHEIDTRIDQLEAIGHGPLPECFSS
ncbi:hypothetical protein HPB47_020659 [Ixodes persulcatus]|uniref:Uncharacterized protein n=1 Tax=Ixodes persulcatus TaxID=34615 RepID=A0AC60QEZ9_IXOPE|nr:hypothetical protein HPB47_020659 [Ixodes persulcatus]